jgi:endonuclease/exonuclease/phosphatase family metal-dependent hydrolase
MPTHFRGLRIILYSLVFLLFFQLVSDFVETIYTFGLLGTNIPPEIVSILFFFSPLILFFFRRGLPRQAGLVLIGSAAMLHALEVVLDKGGKMLSGGLGVGCLLVWLPVWLAQTSEGVDEAALDAGCGLAAALSFSVLLRTLGAGSDISLLHPWLSWLLAVGIIALVIWLSREKLPANLADGLLGTSFGRSAGLSVGFMAGLAVLYFAFISPTVLARWSGVDYRLIVGLLVIALGLYFTALAGSRLARLPKPVVGLWNALFVITGTAAIWVNQVRFPVESSAYPIDQPDLTLVQQVPLLVMILLSPIVLYDLFLLVREMKIIRPSPRALAGGFSLGALFFLIIVLGQVFTTVYDYIPLIGTWFRDRFWLVFSMAGLGMALPVLATLTARVSVGGARQAPRRDLAPILWTSLLALVSAALLAAFGWVIISSPSPVTPEKKDVLRVVTYNIQQGYSADGRRSYANQLGVIRGLKPDIVGLQESDVARFSGGNADVVRSIAEGLKMNAYYGPRTVTGTFGIALLTSYPIENPRTFFMYSKGEQTAAIEAQISVNGMPYTILVTHLGNDGPIIQQEQVLARLAGAQNVIAIGDFNFNLSSVQYGLTLQTLEDAWVRAGSPPAPGLDINNLIDHIFVTPGLGVKAAQYIVSPASDHPALVVDISQ